MLRCYEVSGHLRRDEWHYQSIWRGPARYLFSLRRRWFLERPSRSKGLRLPRQPSVWPHNALTHTSSKHLQAYSTWTSFLDNHTGIGRLSITYLGLPRMRARVTYVRKVQCLNIVVFLSTTVYKLHNVAKMLGLDLKLKGTKIKAQRALQLVWGVEYFTGRLHFSQAPRLCH